MERLRLSPGSPASYKGRESSGGGGREREIILFCVSLLRRARLRAPIGWPLANRKCHQLWARLLPRAP